MFVYDAPFRVGETLNKHVLGNAYAISGEFGDRREL